MVYANNGNSVMTIGGTSTRFRVVPTFVTNPYVEQGATKNAPGSGGRQRWQWRHRRTAARANSEQLDATQQEILQQLKKLFPKGTKFGNYWISVSGLRSDTGYERYATVPVWYHRAQLEGELIRCATGTESSMGSPSGCWPWGWPPSPAHADWLVTREGGRVETKGPGRSRGSWWSSPGPTTAPSPPCAPSEVDLDASAKATADAKVQAEAPPPPEAPQKKLAVLTDKDFRKPTPAGADGAPEKARRRPRSGPLAVSDWKRVDSPSGDGIAVEGSVHNTTDEMMINASVEVQLYQRGGGAGRDRLRPADLDVHPAGRHGRVPRQLPGGLHLRQREVRGQWLPDSTSPPPDDGEAGGPGVRPP